MEKKIIVGSAQFRSKMGDTEYNLEKAIKYCEMAAEQGAKFICFPELFYSGYDLESDDLHRLSEKSTGKMYIKLSKVAKDKKLHIVASYPENGELKGVTYISSMLISENGDLLGNHRKFYVGWKEAKDKKIAEGKNLSVYNTKFGKIGMLICYDTEFPENARYLALKGAKIIFVPLAFMDTKLMSRYLISNALNNLLYIVGANTIGNKKNGESKIIDPLGTIISEAPKDKEELLLGEIDLSLELRKQYIHLDDIKSRIFMLCYEAIRSRKKGSHDKLKYKYTDD